MSATVCAHLGCERSDTRPYLTGPRCASHTPAALAGRPEPDALVDPEATAAALRAKRGMQWAFIANDTSLNDERAIASGRRRSTLAQYRAAQAAQDARRGEF
jgi:hypothetical protein